ncbi:MAG TPA: type IV pilus secretin PilQ [Vicinamibacterales bacterium]|jgi:type IV pilus secretin PilQ/predicted competence protein|nr:type IV pilus secretin PilQ [Vicinamibacterales bacterium]
MYRYSMLLGLCLAMAAGVMAPLGASRARVDQAMLTKIASRVEARTGVIAIEASAPVPYVASQPDPKTFVVELRDVVTFGFHDAFTADPRHPVAAVRVENGQASDGASVARVHMTLTQAIRPRVRSARNVIFVETDRADAAPVVSSGAINLAGPSAAIRDVRVSRRNGATAITLLGTARLTTTGAQEIKDGTNRLVFDLPNTTSALPAVTPVNQGPVEKVRIGINPKSPLLTQVSVDLSRAASYRMESSPDGNDLTVLFDEPVVDPISALKSTASAPKPQQAPPAAAAPAPQPSAPVPVAAQASAASSAQPPQPPQPPARYTGNPVSLDFQGADLRAVLRTFSEISGLNLVIDPSIQGTVDVALRDVPWDQALDIILRANKLGYVVDGTIVRVAPLTVLAEEETQRRKLAEEQALAGELRVLTRSLSYAKADDLTKLLTATVLSQRGSIQTDPRTNTIIINDLADRLDRASALLTTLDRPEPQVEIEARIVQTTREFARRLGVQWGFNAQASQALGNTLPLAFPNQVNAGGRTGVTQGPVNGDGVSNGVNLGIGGATSAAGLALGSINGALNLDVALSAIERSGQGRILSTPKVSTQNNIEAEITQGIQVPIQTVANNTVTVTFKDAALTLRVTPQITAANTVIMRITMENSSPDFSRAVNGIPPIDTQRALTQVLVSSGETTVIGGIYVSREQTSQDRTPGLNRLPLLGWLFKRNEFTDESRELLIFITPKILRL